MKFVINRSKWRCGGYGVRGRGLGDTQLKNSDGYMCCLGMIAKQAGCSDYVITYKETPEDISTKPNKIKLANIGLLDQEYFTDTDLSAKAININDNENYTDKERESKLTELFKEFGHEIEFINDYKKD